MAPSARSYHYHAERGLARPFAKRSSLLGRNSAAPSQSSSAVSASPSPSQTAPAGVTLPPHGVAALIGIVVMLSVFVLGFAGWRIWIYRRNKAAANRAPSEKVSKPVGLFDAVDEDLRIKRTLSGSSSDTIFVAPPTGPKAAMTRERIANEFKINLGYQPKVVYAAPDEKFNHHAAPPGITISPAPPSLQITPPPVYASIPAPALSPRTAASKTPRSSLPPAPSSKFPRLVLVESTFTPTLHDELEIREGETLRLVEEYEDEWCLVQRVGPKDAEKGVVPRFCVIDKPEVTPARIPKHVPRLSSVPKV